MSKNPKHKSSDFVVKLFPKATFQVDAGSLEPGPFNISGTLGAALQHSQGSDPRSRLKLPGPGW